MGHASRGAQGEVFFMTDEAIDSLGANALKRKLRALEGGFCSNKQKSPELKEKLQEAVRQKTRRK